MPDKCLKWTPLFFVLSNFKLKAIKYKQKAAFQTGTHILRWKTKQEFSWVASNNSAAKQTDINY